MRRKAPSPFWFSPILLVIPFIYNSCQAGLFSQAGFSSIKSSCKAGLYKGQVEKVVDFSSKNPFLTKKVRLARNLATVSTANISSGSKLAVVLDNHCAMSGGGQSLTNDLAKGQALNPMMDQQAYDWSIDHDMGESEIEDLASVDPCVVGVSWNLEYKTQAFNDPALGFQTHLNAIHAEASYNSFYGSGGAMNPTTGDPVLVAVVDSGVDWQHPDIYANLLQHRDGIGIDITTLGGTVSYDPMDISPIGHGTHVTGLIAAVANNALGVAGAAPFRVKIMPIKLFSLNANGDMTTTSTNFFNALRVAHQNGAQVINLSLGSINFGPATDALADSAVNEALSQGSTIVTVTGNADGGSNGAEVNGTTLTVIPGIYADRPGVIGVGSFEVATGNKSAFSHYSTTYGEIAAPGAESGTTGLYSTLPRSLNSYGRLAGTSQAAPLVSAAAAMTIGLIKNAYGVAPTPQEVERLILDSAIKDPKLQPYFKNGNRLDLQALVQKINLDYPKTKTTSPSGGDVGSLSLSSTACH